MPTKSPRTGAKKQVARRKKPVPTCTPKDLRKPASKRACRMPNAAPKVPAVKPGRASPTGPTAAPPVTSTAPGAFPTPPSTIAPSAVPIDSTPVVPFEAASDPAPSATPAPSETPAPAPANQATPTATPSPTPTPAATPAPAAAAPATPAATSTPTPEAPAPAPTPPGPVGPDAPAEAEPSAPTPSAPATDPNPVPTDNAPLQPPALDTVPVVVPGGFSAADSVTASTAASIPVYSGPFGATQATRLLFRAGFGPKPGQAAAFAAQGLSTSVESLINPAEKTLRGPAPKGSYLVNGALAPADHWGHLHLEFLDECVRSTDQLGQRMGLILHDWFGVSEGDIEQHLVRNHLNLLKIDARGSFRQLLGDVAGDPAMLRFLDGVANSKVAPNENFAREVMELFALGADRNAYSETDVREMARALTGFRMDWTWEKRSHNFRYDASFHDQGSKTVFGGTAYEKRGNLGPGEAIAAIADHPLHPSFVVLKLWSYFIPTAPPAATQAALETLYRQSGEKLMPLVRAILQHPALYEGPTMVKPPVVYAASLLRARDAGLEDDAWTWLLQFAGQLVGRPPNVSGWNDRAWLNTGTHEYRWQIARNALRPAAATPDSYAGRTGETPAQAIDAALRFWGYPPISAEMRSALETVAAVQWRWGLPNDTYWWQENFLANRQNTLRLMIVASSDFQVS